MVSAVLGLLFFAKIGEKSGRRTALIYCLVLSCFSEFVLFCSASIEFFMVILAFLGFSVCGTLFLPYVMICEISDRKGRLTFSMLMSFTSLISLATVTVLAYTFLT